MEKTTSEAPESASEAAESASGAPESASEAAESASEPAELPKICQNSTKWSPLQSEAMFLNHV